MLYTFYGQVQATQHPTNYKDVRRKHLDIQAQYAVYDDTRLNPSGMGREYESVDTWRLMIAENTYMDKNVRNWFVTGAFFLLR